MLDLVITGCIAPDKDVPYVTIQDPDDRRQQYLETLQWAAKEVDVDNIIFVDTSNYNFSEDVGRQFIFCKKNSTKPIELLSFKANREEVNKRGKGYGEGEAIKYAIEHSKLIDENNDILIKLTGRLKVQNIKK